MSKKPSLKLPLKKIVQYYDRLSREYTSVQMTWKFLWVAVGSFQIECIVPTRGWLIAIGCTRGLARAPPAEAPWSRGQRGCSSRRNALAMAALISGCRLSQGYIHTPCTCRWPYTANCDLRTASRIKLENIEINKNNSQVSDRVLRLFIKVAGI